MDNQQSEEIADAGKTRLGFSLTQEAQRLLREMKKKSGLTQTALVETAIREKAAAMKIE